VSLTLDDLLAILHDAYMAEDPYHHMAPPTMHTLDKLQQAVVRMKQQKEEEAAKEEIFCRCCGDRLHVGEDYYCSDCS
jgi:hypothetical protein